MGINGKDGKWRGIVQEKHSRLLDCSGEIHLSQKLIKLHLPINLLIKMSAEEIFHVIRI